MPWIIANKTLNANAADRGSAPLRDFPIAFLVVGGMWRGIRFSLNRLFELAIALKMGPPGFEPGTKEL